jgi:small subunit ribosomal protein S4
MKRERKRYERPKRPWSSERIDNERKISKEYGLCRKKEIWKAEALLRDFRRRARELVANFDEQQEKLLLNKMIEAGLIKKDAHIDEILALTIENLLDRRLQTIIYKKGFANTAKQARQFIVHGHILVDDRRSTWPSRIIKISEEGKIAFTKKSKVKEFVIKGKKVEKPKPVSVDAKPTDAKKPVDAKPTDAKKPVDAKPAVAKPVEVKTDAKPAEVKSSEKPAEVKADIKPVKADAKPVEAKVSEEKKEVVKNENR